MVTSEVLANHPRGTLMSSMFGMVVLMLTRENREIR